MPRITGYITNVPRAQAVTEPIAADFTHFYQFPVSANYARCKCCGRQIYISSFIDEGFCDSCKALIAEEVFDSKNQFTVCKNIKLM